MFNKDSDGKDALDEAAEWFFRQEDTPLPPADEVRFRAWLAASDENRAAYAEISGTWHELGHLPVPSTEEQFTPVHTRRGLFKPFAATLTLCCFLMGGAWYIDLPTRILADNYTTIGQLQTVNLPDGSRVELNSGSAIAVAYSSGERRIKLLKGEATVTVHADPMRPFIVEAKGGEAMALGTVYSVRETANNVTVTVIESVVAVTGKAGGAPVQLHHDQRIHYQNGQVGSVEQVDADAETAWRRRKLIFVDRPLGDVVDELNRYHNGMIRIVDSSIRERRVSGVFDTTNIVGVIDALKKSFGFRDTRLGDLLILIHQ